MLLKCFQVFSLVRVVLYSVFMVFSLPETLVKTLVKHLVKNLAKQKIKHLGGLFGPFQGLKKF